MSFFGGIMNQRRTGGGDTPTIGLDEEAATPIARGGTVPLSPSSVPLMSMPTAAASNSNHLALTNNNNNNTKTTLEASPTTTTTLKSNNAHAASSATISAMGWKVLILLAVQNSSKNLLMRFVMKERPQFLTSAAVIGSESTKLTLSILYICLLYTSPSPRD